MSNPSLIVGWRKRWNRSLLQFLRRRVRVAVDIEDLAQETYMRLLRARHLAEVRNPQAYLLRVAGHVVSEWRDRHPPEDPLSLLDESQLIDAVSLECELDAQLSQQRLDRVLADVSAATRSVLVLRFRDELTHCEIAQALAMTERQVRRHLVKGYEHLRRAFKELNGVRLDE
jgi:RNA polymerase sigma-70 factor (ECF subfamily)